MPGPGQKEKCHTRREFLAATLAAPLALNALSFGAPDGEIVVESPQLKTRGPAWPRVIPARTKDSGNRDLFVTTLGNVKTPLADSTFDPAKDEIRTNNGPTKSDYYKKTLGIKFFTPIDKSVFPLPPAGLVLLVLLLPGDQRERDKAQREMDRGQFKGFRRRVCADRRRMARRGPGPW